MKETSGIMDTLINIQIGSIKEPDSLHVADLTENEHKLLVNYKDFQVESI